MGRWLWVVPLIGGGWAGATLIGDGRYWIGASIILAALAFTWHLVPWRGGSFRTHVELQSLPADERPVVIYWRPGCSYCARLRVSLGRTGSRAEWVNVWRDAEASEYIRGVNDGNEVVPTVVIDGEPHTNPNPGVVKERLEQLPD